MIDINDAILLLRAVLMVLKHFGVTPPVDDKLLAKAARRILPAISSSPPVQNAIFWLNVQCEDGVLRLASAWEAVRRVLDSNKALFWSMAMDLCRDLHPSEWLSKARAAAGKLHLSKDGSISKETPTATVEVKTSGIELPNSKL